MKRRNTFCSIGISYVSARAGLRDCVALPLDAARTFRDAAAALGVGQVLALSTCNRTEIFFWGEADLQPLMQDLFRRQFPQVDSSGVLQTRTGCEALAELAIKRFCS